MTANGLFCSNRSWKTLPTQAVPTPCHCLLCSTLSVPHWPLLSMRISPSANLPHPPCNFSFLDIETIGLDTDGRNLQSYRMETQSFVGCTAPQGYPLSHEIHSH